MVSALGLALIVASTAMIWLAFRICPPRSVCLVLVGAKYAFNLKVEQNVPGWRGLEALQQFAAGSKTSAMGRFGRSEYRVLNEQVNSLEASSTWLTQLQDIPEQTIIVAISAHGGVEKEDLYFLQEDARPLDTDGTGRVRFPDILDALKRLPREKNKVLILDATRLTHSLELGMLNNNFARVLEGYDKDISSIDNLVVASASGIDQVSWVSHAWQQSVFLHYLVENLGDTHRGLNKIRFDELFFRTHNNVKLWSKINNAALQSPVLYPLNGVGLQRSRGIALPAAGPNGLLQNDTQLYKREGSNTIDISNIWYEIDRLKTYFHGEPFAEAPHRWHLYVQNTRRLAELIRLNEDLRPESKAGVQTLKARRDELQEEIKDIYFKKLKFSGSFSLPMPIVQGFEDPSYVSQGLVEPFRDWWKASDVEQQTFWFKYIKAKDTNFLAGLDYRFPVGDLLLGWTAEIIEANPVATAANDLAKATRLANYLFDDPDSQPVEIQFLVSLGREFGRLNDSAESIPSERWVLLAHALRLRRIAERTALGLKPSGSQSDSILRAGTIALYIQDLVGRGDQYRREGEDLLFSSEPRDWETAEVYFEKAQKCYQSAISVGAKVCEIFKNFDEILSELPSLTRWTTSARQTDKHKENLMSLWHKVNDFCEILEDVRSDQLENLHTKASDLRHLFSKVQEEFRDHCQNLVNAKPRPRLVEECLAALVVPSLSLSTRRALETSIETLKNNELKFSYNAETLENKENSFELQKLAINPESEESIQASAEAQELAIVRGQFTLTALEIDEGLLKTRRKWNLIRDRKPLNVHDQLPGLGHRSDRRDTTRDLSLADSGSQIRLRMQVRLATINEMTSFVERNLEVETRKQVFQLDRVVRAIDDVSNAAIDSSKLPFNPRTLYSRQNLLCTQADRAYLDYWDNEPSREGSTPYFRTVARAYLADAKALDTREVMQTGRVQQSEAVSDRSLEFLFSGPDREVEVENQQVHLNYRFESKNDRQLLDPALPQIRGRVVIRLQGHSVTRPVAPIEAGSADPPDENGLRKVHTRGDFSLSPKKADPDVTAIAFFRGWQAKLNTRIDRYLQPRIRAISPPPPARAGLLVGAGEEVIRKGGEEVGAAAIVLDCSRSMESLAGKGRSTKFREATEALGDLLQQIPRGVWLSVWVFGQAETPNKTIEPELNIRRVHMSARWDPSFTPQLMASISRDSIEPWNLSPIVQAMRSAVDDLSNRPGPKTLVVLTDGQDNRWQGDARNNPERLDVGSYLRKEARPGGKFADVAINVIGFQIEGGQRDEALSQLAIVSDLPTPGRYCLVDQQVDLIAELTRIFRPRLKYLVMDHRTHVPFPPIPLAFALSQRNTVLSGRATVLSPGGFQIGLHTTDGLNRDLALYPGDCLLLGLVPTATGTQFVRLPYVNTFHSSRPTVLSRAGDWQMGILQQSQDKPNGLKMMISLEKRPDEREAPLQQIHPREAWFELRPDRGGERGLSLEIGRVYGLPATVYSINATNWPQSPDGTGPSRPVVQAWWSPDRDVLATASFRRAQDFTRINELVGRLVPIDGHRVTIDSIAVENQEVTDSGGSHAQRPCLVVRVSHPPDQPVWIRPVGLAGQEAGQEHRFFDEAGKTVALFWPVTAIEVETQLNQLDIIAVKSFKRDAEARGFTALLESTERPASDDPPPEILIPVDAARLMTLEALPPPPRRSSPAK